VETENIKLESGIQNYLHDKFPLISNKFQNESLELIKEWLTKIFS